MRDRLAIAHRTVDGKPQGDEDVAGIAIWASVSDAVDAKITEQVKAGVFPVRLAGEDWVSGDKVWLLDVIAGDRKGTAVLTNFRQLSGERAVKIHPLVARLIDPEVLEKLRGAAEAGARKPQAPADTAAFPEPRGSERGSSKTARPDPNQSQFKSIKPE
jgi:cytolysin-activating lysine-acyltransferase